MPHIDSLTPKPHAFPRLFGQLPLTRVRDYSRSIKVDLVKHDDPSTMLNGTYDFAKATWSEDGRESERATLQEKEDALSQMLAGKTLQLGLETVQFIFRISGITRIDTHQIVRQRVGVTFSQQCSGDQFWTHHDVLVEPSIKQELGPYSAFLTTALQSKQVYQEMLDTQKISVQAARSILPHCLETFVFMRIDLATLLFFHQKRIDDGSQTWQMNEVAQQMADRVIEIFPQTAVAFEKSKTRFKFQVEASKDRTNSFSTGLYLPSPDNFEYHDQDFLYPQTKNKMHLVGDHKVDEFPTEYYLGTSRLSESEYKEFKAEYELVNKLAEKEHLTNDEILLANQNVNFRLMKLFNLK